MTADFVFGYGALVDEYEGAVAELHGWQRLWGVAMDNTVTIPGYKLYRAPDGSRPAVCVAFLDIEQRAGAVVNGLCLPVTERRLAALDARERNYRRTEVTASIADPPGRVWAYSGREAGRARLRAGARAVIQADYLRAVEDGFRALGQLEYEAFLASSDLDGLPVWDLERVDLPADAPPAEEGA